MKKLQKIRFLLVIAAFLLLLGVVSAEERPLVENGKEMLLLRNGQFFEGRITKIKDHYVVDMPDSEIQVRAAEVEFVCRNLEDGYRRKRSVIQAGNWRDHLELARWCQKHEILKEANAEMAAAEAISPGNPMVALLRRQMEDDGEPTVKSEKSPPHDTISNEELDRMVRNLPAGTVETYTQTVQPVLINNCTASGCHGPQSQTPLRLYRTPTGEQANRRLTQRNLYAVLRYIDRENPAESPLLTVPSKPHGTAKTAIFTEHRAGQYYRMVEWATGLGQNDYSIPYETLVERKPSQYLSDDPDDDASSPPRLLSRDAMQAKPLATSRKNQRQPVPAANAASNEVQPASYQEPPAEFLQSNHSRNGSAKPLKASNKSEPQLPQIDKKVKRGAPPPQTGPKDPFDPEIFNRRYHNSGNPSEGEKPPLDSSKTKNSSSEG